LPEIDSKTGIHLLPMNRVKTSAIAVFEEIFKVLNISGNKNIERYGDGLAVFFFENDFSAGVDFDDVCIDLPSVFFFGPDPRFAIQDADEQK
jgi:hypothetical protein